MTTKIEKSEGPGKDNLAVTSFADGDIPTAWLKLASYDKSVSICIKSHCDADLGFIYLDNEQIDQLMAWLKAHRDHD